MANMRDKNKVRVAAWVEADLRKRVNAVLAKRGLTLTDEITKLLNKILDEELKDAKGNKKN